LRSLICVPLSTGDGVLGALTLLSAEREYGAAELELAGELARRAAATIQTARTAERYQMLFESSPLPMWVYDAETLEFLNVNDAAIRHYGYTREEFLSMTIREIRPPEDVAAMLVDVAAR